MCDYDTIIIGGGIAGMMAALRLRSAGERVAVFDKGLIGAESSTGNHGQIHSGSMYVELHPEIHRQCQEAVKAFSAAFPQSTTEVKEALYFGGKERIYGFMRLLDRYAKDYRAASTPILQSYFHDDLISGISGFLVPERFVSPRDVMCRATQTCIEQKVDLYVNTAVKEVCFSGGKVVGIRVGRKEIVTSAKVVIAAGLGTKALLRSLGSHLSGQLRSRLDIMATCSNIGLDRPLLSLDYGGPTIAPNRNGKALVSLYGGEQPTIERGGKWSTPWSGLNAIKGQIDHLLKADLLESRDCSAYMHSKTEVSNGHSDGWGVEPGFSLTNHDWEALKNLWTVIPGKFTLAFHASQQLAISMGMVDERLDLNVKWANSVTEAASGLVAHEPWAEISKCGG